MKLNKFKQILKLYILNSRAYDNVFLKDTNLRVLTDSNLIQMISNLKKALYIIFEYHQAHKKILFVGLPKKLELKINKLTYHSAVDFNFELRGIISNNFKVANFIQVENKILSKIFLKSLVLKLSQKPDLIVLFSHKNKQDLILESNVAKIPVISVSTQYSNVNKNLGFILDKSLFFGLHFLFKKKMFYKA